MAKKKEITFSFYIGDEKVDKIPPEFSDKMAEAVGKALSRYYSAHPEEYVLIKEDLI